MAKGIKTGGRKKGSTNKVGADVRDLAQKYTAEAIAKLVEIMNDPAAPLQAKVAACKEILDRGHGKAPQAITGGDGNGPVMHNVEVHIVDHRPADKN